MTTTTRMVVNAEPGIDGIPRDGLLGSNCNIRSWRIRRKRSSSRSNKKPSANRECSIAERSYPGASFRRGQPQGKPFN